MKLRTLIIALSVSLFASISMIGQSEALYPLESIKPGQKGYGKTVFEGTSVESFEVEILGVLKNIGPKQNLILARLRDDRLDHTGIFAGMSGSPVYIEDRLIGAVAYTFPFSKEPIAGITPIQEMIDVFEEAPESRFRIGRIMNPLKMYAVAELSDLLPHGKRAHFSVDSHLLEGSNGGKLQPISTPLSLSGFSPTVIQEFTPQWKTLGLVPVRGTGTAKIDDYEDTPLQPGSTVSVQLVRGDLDVNASGTVTHVSGSQVYAFGHPFLGIGYTDLPLNKAAVLTIIPTLSTSQKISAPTKFIGSIKQDRSTGILGLVGEKSDLLPVTVKLHTSRNELKEFNYEIVTDNFLTPFLLTFTVHNSIISSERAIGGQTLQVKCRIFVQGQRDVNFENSVSDLNSSSALAAIAAASPVNFLLNSGFENLVMERINVEIDAVEQTREAILEKVWQDKVEVKAGEELGLTVFLRRSDGETVVEKYPVKIPEEINPGPLKIVVADGISLLRSDAEMNIGQFIPENLEQLIEAINNLKKNDRLYIRLSRDQSGAVVAGEGLPGLPPSLLALYGAEKTSSGIKPISKAIYVEHELPPTNLVLQGRQEINVNVK